jgi:hypothetical protein
VERLVGAAADQVLGRAVAEYVDGGGVDELDHALGVDPEHAVAHGRKNALQTPALVVDRLAVAHGARERAQAREVELLRLALEQALDRARGQRLLDHRVGVGAGEDRREHVRERRVAAELRDQRRAVRLRHEVVDDRDVEGQGARLLEPVGHTERRLDLVALLAHELGEREAHRRRVVHQQHAQRAAVRVLCGFARDVRVQQLVQRFGSLLVVGPEQQRRARARHAPVHRGRRAAVGQQQHGQMLVGVAMQQSKHVLGDPVGVLRPAKNYPGETRGRAAEALQHRVSLVRRDQRRHREALLRQQRGQRTAPRGRGLGEQDGFQVFPCAIALRALVETSSRRAPRFRKR